MKKRKTKSRMTRVDLDAVLKLQKDYTTLQCECMRLFELVQDRVYGLRGCHIVFDNDYLAHIAALVEHSLQPIDVKEILGVFKHKQSRDE